MNVLSLFSGIGGLDLGLQRAGMTIAGQVEIDPWCRKVLAKHWPEVPRHDDVRTCAGWWGDRAAPDLVAGGFPCQPVSVAGKRQGEADSRWLWPAFAATVRHLRPRFVLVENNPGLTSLGMGRVVGDLAALGYDAEWDCLPACWFGAPHIRERIFLVAYPASGGCVGTDDDQREHTEARRGEWQCPQHDRLTGQAGSEPVVLADTAGARPSNERAAPGRRPSTPRRVEPQRLGGQVADPSSARRSSGPCGTSRPVWHTPWWSQPQRRGWWPAEPDVGRVVDGLSDGLDRPNRIRALGNAVVPQVAEHIGRMIMAVTS